MSLIKFPTFASALTFILAQEADRSLHAFTVTYIEGRSADAALDELPDDVGPEAAYTLTERLVNPSNVSVSAVGSEAHYGYILSHYTEGGKPVRFYAII